MSNGCGMSCTGTTVTRFVDYDGNYVHFEEGCGIPEPITYPNQVHMGGDVEYLDTSSGNVSGIDFDIP